MRIGLVIGLAGLVGLALTAPPLPPVPKIAKARAKLSKRAKAAVVTQGAGAAALISKAVVVVAAPGRTNTFAWAYPKTITASNCWWNLETSTDLVHWTVVCSNATGDYTVTNNLAEPGRWWRLQGRGNP